MVIRAPIEPNSDTQPRPWCAALRCSAGPILLAVLFVVLASWSWRKWPDLLVDFGHELYVPWQLSRGHVLYRDLAFLYGPLSQYVNALWFTLFGVQLTTLIVCNLAILAALTALIYAFLAAATDRFTATASCVVLLGVFAFCQYLSTGNYNFVCPYSHEATHGTALAVAMLSALSRYARRPALHWCLLSGLSLGLAMLTRAEIGVAAAGGAVAAGAVLRLLPRTAKGSGWLGLMAFIGAAAAPIIVAFGLFLRHMPAAQALGAAGGAWTALVDGKVTQNAFFISGMGLDAPMVHLRAMLKSFAWLAGSLSALAVVDTVADQLGNWRNSVARLTSLAVFAVAVWHPALIPWNDVIEGLPLTVLCAGAGLCIAIVRCPAAAGTPALVALLSWTAFAFALLGKMILNVRVYHYGFYLAMPATLTLVVLVVWAIPAILQRVRGGGYVFRCMTLALVAAGVAYHLRWCDRIYQTKDLAVGPDGDTIIDYAPTVTARGVAVGRTLQLIETLLPGNDTFVALPEGVMLNYLSRRANPIPYTTFMPTELAVFGEPAILDALQAHPPDLIILIHKDTREFGVGYFGRDPRYGMLIMNWVRHAYESVQVIIHPPLVDRGFGIEILRRGSTQPSS